jgi:hypothetical protein
MNWEGDATVTLAPGETWIADQQCMTYYEGNYLADWVPMNEGDPWHNRTDHEVTFSVDYGRAKFTHEGGTCTCWTTNGDVGCPDRGAST